MRKDVFFSSSGRAVYRNLKAAGSNPVGTQEKITAWIKPLKSFTGYFSADNLFVANDFFSAKKWLRIRQIYANI